MFFRKKHPYHPHYMNPRHGYYPYPYRRNSSGIFFLLIVLVGVYILYIKGYLLSPDIIPFWFLALVIIAVFFLFKRREAHY